VPKSSAGLLIYRLTDDRLEVLLVHPGGPFFKKRDEGSWSIPKGELSPGEEPLAAARRELTEETGFVSEGPYEPLGSVTQRGGKHVVAFACLGDFDVDALVSNEFELEWPPRAGRKAMFPEVDRAEYFDIDAARRKINPAQAAFLSRLEAWLGDSARRG
jgi:predicted NUDIX family NTP pyrophosphohydrolase